MQMNWGPVDGTACVWIKALYKMNEWIETRTQTLISHKIILHFSFKGVFSSRLVLPRSLFVLLLELGAHGWIRCIPKKATILFQLTFTTTPKLSGARFAHTWMLGAISLIMLFGFMLIVGDILLSKHELSVFLGNFFRSWKTENSPSEPFQFS